MLVRSAFEGDRKVALPARRQALTGRNDARAPFVARNADSTLMRMGGKKLDHTGRGGGIEQKSARRFERRYLLVVAIASRVVVRPGNRLRLYIVGHVSRFVEFSILTIKEMRAAHAWSDWARRRNQARFSVYFTSAGVAGEGEPLGSTGLGHSAAIPHVRLEGSARRGSGSTARTRA